MSSMTTIAGPAVALPAGAFAPERASGRAETPKVTPAGRSIVAVYAICLLLALAYPQALASWLDDFEPNPVVEAAQSCVSRLVLMSENLGIARISGTVRDLGRSITRKPT